MQNRSDVSQPQTGNNAGSSRLRALFEVLAASVKLGLTSFGGPVAHLGYFHEEYVRKRKWLDDRSYADLVALCQFLPGPASSQVGIGIGVIRAGLAGGLVAWLGFTLPSVFALVLFAMFVQQFDIGDAGWVHGLKIAAVAIVAQAVIGMGQKLANGRSRATIAAASAAVALMWQSAFSQIAIIAAAGLLGAAIYRMSSAEPPSLLRVSVGKRTAAGCLILFAGLLIALPLLRQIWPAAELAWFDSYYRAGSLVFGGGHVVLPMLESETVSAGWVGKEAFLAGYGAAQAVPGPLFTFAAYLGAVSGGLGGALIATAAIFLPAFLLVIGSLPFWNSLRNSRRFQGALAGINAAVVGILIAALYNPLWTTTVLLPADFALAAVLFLLLHIWKSPPWAIVAAGALGGSLIYAIA